MHPQKHCPGKEPMFSSHCQFDHTWLGPNIPTNPRHHWSHVPHQSLLAHLGEFESSIPYPLPIRLPRGSEPWIPILTLVENGKFVSGREDLLSRICTRDCGIGTRGPPLVSGLLRPGTKGSPTWPVPWRVVEDL